MSDPIVVADEQEACALASKAKRIQHCKLPDGTLIVAFPSGTYDALPKRREAPSYGAAAERFNAEQKLGKRAVEIIKAWDDMTTVYPDDRYAEQYERILVAARSLGLLDTTAERDAKAKGPNPTAPTPAPGERCPRCHRRKGTGHLPGCLLDGKEGA